MYGIDVQDIHVLFFRIFKSYGDVESHMRMKFKPHNPPGPRLGRMITREKLLHFTKAVDFLLFLTANIIEDICFNTNLYGWLHILEKTSYADAEGCWKEVDRSELLRFIGLIIYMGIVKVSSISRYWSTAPPPLYHGLWSRRFMSRDRFKALLGMLHITPPDQTDPTDKLHKVRPLLDHIRPKCKELYSADVNVSVDERMVKSKGRSGIRQYIKNKPVKFGFKLWVLAESNSGFTIDFNVYTGKRQQTSTNGLAYDVVTT